MTNRKRHARHALLVLVTASLVGFFACEREIPTSVKVSAGPSFSFSGSGRLALFTIYAPRNGERIAYPDPDVASVVWQIKASKGYFEGVHVQGFQLAYGKIPEGYIQVVPSESQAARPLPPGAVYAFYAETSGAPVAGGTFYVDKSGPVQVKFPGPCLTIVNGRKLRVKCDGTNEPFQEPIDLESFARQHQMTQSQ